MDHGNTNLPTLVRLVSKDGNLVKEYRLHFKSTFQTTPTEGVKNLVAEAQAWKLKRLRFRLKKLFVKTLNLLKVNVVSFLKDRVEKKIDYIQVLGTTRSLVHSEERKAQDRIVEVWTENNYFK